MSGRRWLALTAMALSAQCLAQAQAQAQAQCHIAFDAARAELGELRRPLAAPPAWLELPQRLHVLTATCQPGAAMVVNFVGMPRQQGFAFGSDGDVQLRVAQALLDGQPVELQTLEAAEPGQGGADLRVVRPGDRLVAVRDGTPLQGAQLVLHLISTPRLRPAQFNVREQRTVEASLAVHVSTY
ncbi:hypothetical protein SFA35_11300 [Pseudomonas sp. HR96]|uniref:hypothetical protein n=1 Tax=Pseudomonas sp. HR96 TaxID=1027966 RepID=UPI002A762686|nr:hypothetical protein [Pseudomonas sp. HR96]WPP01891.1 hypothetical protein SFA35_11300 [Pseudomonas sp. HR96]